MPKRARTNEFSEYAKKMREMVESLGGEQIGVYVDSQTPIDCICPNGHSCRIRWNYMRKVNRIVHEFANKSRTFVEQEALFEQARQEKQKLDTDHEEKLRSDSVYAFACYSDLIKKKQTEVDRLTALVKVEQQRLTKSAKELDHLKRLQLKSLEQINESVRGVQTPK